MVATENSPWMAKYLLCGSVVALSGQIFARKFVSKYSGCLCPIFCLNFDPEPAHLALNHNYALRMRRLRIDDH